MRLKWGIEIVILTVMLICVTEGQRTPNPRNPNRRPNRRPNRKPSKKPGRGPPMTPVGFLRKFGYLEYDEKNAESEIVDETSTEVKNAVMNFQNMANLPMTGELDDKTMDMINKPRCGVHDMDSKLRTRMNKSRGRGGNRGRFGPNNLETDTQPMPVPYVLGGSKWQTFDLTYRILSYTADLRQWQVNEAMEKAFRIWSDVAPLNFRKVNEGFADIYISFGRSYHGDGYPFDGIGMVLAHAFFPGEDIGGDMHFDEDERWTRKSYDGTNLFIVAAHELGHSLGLAHSNTLGALMYPWYQGYTPNFQLHQDDINGIQALYGKRETYIPTAPPPTTTMAPGMTPSSTRPPFIPDKTTIRPTMSDDRPPECRAHIDAVSVIRGELFFFSDKWFWRRDSHNRIMVDYYPAMIDLFWLGLPTEYGVDAVYERPDGKIVFFIGPKYFLFDGNSATNGFPPQGKPITDFGFPASLTKIDAAFIWGQNEKTYMMSGNMYWRYNEIAGRMDEGYPKDMSMWPGVPSPLDSAFTFWDGITYFFQGEYYYKFDNAKMRISDDRSYPRHVGSYWLHCVNNN